jgi:hypothetical protein
MKMNASILNTLSLLHKSSEPENIRFTATEPFYIHIEDEYLSQELDTLRLELSSLKEKIRDKIERSKDPSP